MHGPPPLNPTNAMLLPCLASLPLPADVPWEGSSSGFSGSIVHHEEAARLRALLSEVDRAAAEVKGALDAAAAAGGAPAGEEEVYRWVGGMRGTGRGACCGSSQRSIPLLPPPSPKPPPCPAPAAPARSFDAAGNAVPPEGSVGAYVVTSIERVFNHNFDPNAVPSGGSGGYAVSGRHRSQRELRREYDRLTRFSGLIAKTLEKASK